MRILITAIVLFVSATAVSAGVPPPFELVCDTTNVANTPIKVKWDGNILTSVSKLVFSEDTWENPETEFLVDRHDLTYYRFKFKVERRLSMNYRNIYLLLEKDGSVESAMFEEAVVAKSFLMYGMSFYMNRCVTTLKP